MALTQVINKGIGAGNTVTGEGSATTSLQQGLAKSWCYISSNGSTLSDSLNIGSIADNGTGSYQANFTNHRSLVSL